MNILLVEDNISIAEGLKFTFEKNNYKFTYTESIKAAKEYLVKKQPDLIILDVTLPDGNGFNLYETYIKNKKIPTIFLTAKDDENDIVKGLEIGAEDYITKPFSTKELLTRVNKVILRSKKSSIVQVKNIKMDLDKLIVYKDEEKIELSSLELKILNMLFLNINKVVRRNDIIELIWESTGNDVDDHTVTVYLKRIREKLASDIITTIKGIGYRIDEIE